MEPELGLKAQHTALYWIGVGQQAQSTPLPPPSSRAQWVWTLSMSRNRGASRIHQYLAVSGLGFLVTALELLKQ